MVSLLIFFLFGCSKPKSKISFYHPLKSNESYISQEKNSKKDPNQITIQTTFQNSQLENIPEFKIDWSNYPTIDIEKLTKKPLLMVDKITNVEEFLRDKYYLEVVGNFIVSYDNNTGILSCVDMKSKKYLWGIRGYLNNEYGQGQGYIKNQILICTTALTYYNMINSVVSLDLATGKEKWKFVLPEWNQKTNERSPYILDVSEEQVLIRSVNRNDSKNSSEYLLALDSNTGKEIWRCPYQIPNDMNYFLEKNMVIFSGVDCVMHAINKKSGKQIWENKDIKKSMDNSVYFRNLSEETIFLEIGNTGIDKNSYFIIDQKTGKIEKKGIELLNPKQNPKINLHYFDESMSYAIFLLSLQSFHYISLVDVVTMKEKWRIPIGKWDDERYSSYMEFSKVDAIKDRMFLVWVGEKENPGDTENIGEGVLPDGLYEIELKTGKILWRTKYGCGAPRDGQAIFYADVQDGKTTQFGSLDLVSKKVKWALNLKGVKSVRGIARDNPNFDFTLERTKANKSRDRYSGYLEIDIDNGNILAYYPYNYEEDGLECIFYFAPYRLFRLKDKNEIWLMEPMS